MDKSLHLIWPLSVVIPGLKLVIPEGISQPIFSTTYDFSRVTLLNAVMLDIPYDSSVQTFMDSIRSRDVYPMEDLEKLTKTKTMFQGRLGYVELLFRGEVKRRKRIPGEWYNTDFGVSLGPRTNAVVKSDIFRMYGIDKSAFELSYYTEIGTPFGFEQEMVSRLEKTRSGPYYAVLNPFEKKDRIQSKNVRGFGVVNETHRFVAENPKLAENVCTVIQQFRTDQIHTSTVSIPTKGKSIPASIRKQVWRVYNGNVGSAPCFVCNLTITALEYECGHIQPKSMGGPNVVSNLLPICGMCNRSMSDKHLFLYAQEHFQNTSCRCFTLDMYKKWCSERFNMD